MSGHFLFGLPMLANLMIVVDCKGFLVGFYNELESHDCSGCPRSEFTARRCLNLLKPKLNTLEEDSWEELDTLDIGGGAESLRWLVWVCLHVHFFSSNDLLCLHHSLIRIL